MNLENMYEGKDINIILENKKLSNFLTKKFLLEENINEHQKLTLEMETDILQKKIMESTVLKDEAEIKIELSGSLGKKKIFEGIVDYFEVLDYGSEGCRILIKAFSKSILFDRKFQKKYRVFQDVTYTYANIIEEINKDYTEKKMEIKYTDKIKVPIGSLIVQYNETDWEFIVRLASHLKTGLFVTEQGLIVFGVMEAGEIKEENRYFSSYSIVRDRRNFYYKVKSNKVVSLGDTVSILNDHGLKEKEEENQKNEKNLFTILKSKIFLENYILKSEFLATDINKYNFYKKYNENIRGCRIEAKVEKVFEEGNIAKMEVTFFEGLNKIAETRKKASGDESKAYSDYGIKRYPLSYQTFYSQTNTGFFCTPEIKDNVEVYFPSEDESLAAVSWAINNVGSGRFSNYEKRNFQINGKDFNLVIDKNSMTINMTESYTRNSKTSMETAESFVNKGTKNMVVISDDYTGIESIGKMSIYGNGIDIIGKESSVKIETPDEIRIKGKKVHNN